MKELLNIVYDKAHESTCDLNMYLPDTNSPCPVLIYFHGGGIEAGTKKGFSDLKNITSKGIALVSAEYRLYPNAKF